MADVVTRGTLFDKTLVKDLINKVKGKSALAALCDQEPIPFNGSKEFTFAMDDEVALVAESGGKSRGHLAIAPVTIMPVKIEYGARLSDEFLYATEEEQIDILKNFNDGFAKKAARALDLMGFHGVNPRTNTIATILGTNYFDSQVTQTVENADNVAADDKIEAAIGLVHGNEEDVTGAAMSSGMRDDLAKIKLTTGEQKYKDLAWGNAPSMINGLQVEFNSTVGKDAKDSNNNTVKTDLAVVGNFRDYFKWGYAKEIPMEIIKYGDPDNSGRDLKGYNEVYIRCEAYIGWGILVPTAFARVTAELITLGTLTVASAAGSGSGDTAITITETKATGHIYKYKVAAAAQEVELNQNVSAWTTWDGSSDITAATGTVITVVEATAAGAARLAGSATVVAHA